MSDVKMIRYGRVNGNPKNTLYTVRVNDLIYFGIARCNPKSDRFCKENGKNIAYNRALLAIEEVSDGNVFDLNIHNSGLRGVCNKDNVIDMLEYFENIDEEMRNRN